MGYDYYGNYVADGGTSNTDARDSSGFSADTRDITTSSDTGNVYSGPGGSGANIPLTDTGYGGGSGSLQNLAQSAMGGGYTGYGGAGGGNLGQNMGAGGGAGYRGYGAGASSGNASGYGPAPSRIGSTLDAPTIQSPQQLSAAGPLTVGANYQQNDPQANAPGGQLSGAGQAPSMWDQLAQTLGGVSPVSTGSQDTLTPEDVQASPFKGPWTGTDTGQGRQFGAPYGQNQPASTEGRPNTNWAGYDPQAGGEAAPSGGARPPSGGTETGWFSQAGAGGEAAPMGGAPPPGGTAPGAGWFAPEAGAGGEAAPAGGETPPWNWYSRPDNFATQFEAAPQGQAVPADRVSAADQLDLSGQTAETPGDAALRGRLMDIAGPSYRPGGWGPPSDQTAKGDQLRTVPSTADQSANLAMQGVDALPPGGSLAGGGTGFDPGAFTGAPPTTFAGVPAGGQFDPNAFVGTNPPGPFQRGASTFGDDPNSFQPGIPGTTAGTETPPVEGSPADPTFAQRLENAPTGQAVSPLQAFTGTPIGPAPDPNADPPQNVPLPRPVPGQPSGPVQTAEGAPTPRASSTATAVSPAPATVAGAPAVDARGQGVGRETDPQYNPPQPGSLQSAISNLFGGGTLGDTVSKLMLQLGIPAALIFAATRGGGGAGRLGLVGGQSAMSGAGRGGFAPQFSRNLFPGPGLPALAGLGLAGAAIGNRLANPTQPGQSQDHPPTIDRGPQAPADPNLTLPHGPKVNLPIPVPHRPSTPAARPDTVEAGGAATQAESFIQQRGGHTAGAGAPALDPEFASRVQRAAMTYEAETGRRAVFDETGRSRDVQTKYRTAFESGQGGLAAKPGTSRHEKGLAIDIPGGDFQNWMHRNAGRFGLEGLRDPRDPNHFQMASPVMAGIRQRQAANGA